MIYLIEKVWIDPTENHNYVGYTPQGYVETIDEANKIVNEGYYYTETDHWCYRGGYKEFRYTGLNKL